MVQSSQSAAPAAGAPLKLFIANRGEIALRIQSTALSFPLPTSFTLPSSKTSITPHGVGCASEADAPHLLRLPRAQRSVLANDGVKAYLDVQAIVAAAKQANSWAVHPGYGFLSESPALAAAVEATGMVWVGPSPQQLELFGNKTSARELASKCGVPTLPGTGAAAASVEQVVKFAQGLPNGAKVMLKAVSGGGGRGMRVIDPAQAGSAGIQEAYASCAREAEGAFGDGRLYAERFLENARHIEVQVVGDGTGDVAHLWERECSLQRRHQKLIEFAPSPTLVGGADSELRQRLLDAALGMAAEGKYRSLGTFEFLVSPTGEFFFMEANPRIQVEHTVTEQITHYDLVSLQLRIALGETLADLGLGREAAPLPFPSLAALQVRVNSESIKSTGEAYPAAGQLAAFSPPSGAGVRVDTAAHAPIGSRAYVISPSFDSLLAKVIITAPRYTSAVPLALRALDAFVIAGCDTNLSFVRELLAHAAVQGNTGIHTAFVEQNFTELYVASEKYDLARREASQGEVPRVGSSSTAVARPEGTETIDLPLSGTMASIDVAEGDEVKEGQQIAVFEAMKMEHVVRAPKGARIEKILLSKGQVGQAGSPLLFYTLLEGREADVEASKEMTDLDHINHALAAVKQREHNLTDAAREKQVQRRRDAGYLTGRENLALLADDRSFIEFGGMALAAQKGRIDEERLLQTTAGDGVITGWATVNAAIFGGESKALPSPARCAVCIYDYMVLAGTQGHFHHLKLDRLFRSVLENPAPLVLYGEGGGGRPGDVDMANVKVSGLDTPSFTLLALIKARGYPSIGVANGYTFAGNAAVLGTCDIVVATRGGAADAKKPLKTSIGMGGPAMIEAGGLGVYKPEEVGPVEDHALSGGVDIVVPTEREAAVLVKLLVGYFQGQLPRGSWRHTADQRALRHLLPASRLRAYDVRDGIRTIADDETFVEIGEAWGRNLLTGFMRIEGAPVGIVASFTLSPLGGAIDAASALKAIRFVNLLTRTRAAHLVVMCDSPGFMVGPAAEREGGMRIFPELFASMAAFTDGGGRIFALTLRRAYGMGAQALLGGSTLANFFSASWPEGEFAGMSIEGAVKLAMRKELEAIEDPKDRQEMYRSMVDMMYDRGQAVNQAAVGEIDAVLDPAATRHWIRTGLASVRARTPTWMSEPGKAAHL